MPIFPNLEPQYFVIKQIQLDSEEFEIIQNLTRGISGISVPFVPTSGFDSLALGSELSIGLEGDPNPQPNISFNEEF